MQEVLNQCETRDPVYGAIVDKQILMENLQQNCIPEDFASMDISNYQDFLVERRKLIAEKIHNYYIGL